MNKLKNGHLHLMAVVNIQLKIIKDKWVNIYLWSWVHDIFNCSANSSSFYGSSKSSLRKNNLNDPNFWKRYANVKYKLKEHWGLAI